MLWTYHTDAPVRIAPEVVDGRLYVGSDDGMARCLDAMTGKLLWS
ncbi:MAG: PQQ-binding-like beta-propeller repeat protein [Limisphaerales bacterium]